MLLGYTAQFAALSSHLQSVIGVFVFLEDPFGPAGVVSVRGSRMFSLARHLFSFPSLFWILIFHLEISNNISRLSSRPQVD